MAPARVRKILYLLTILAVLMLSLSLLIKFRGEPWAPLILVAALLIPGRVQGYFYRDFFRGRREMAEGQFDLAIEHFSRFAEHVRQRPWLKRLIWLSFGVYTADIEAMTYNNLGACNLEKRDLPGARKELYRALELCPTYPMPYFNLGLMSLVQSDRRHAAKCFREAKRLGFEASRLDNTLTAMGQRLADIEGHRALPGPTSPPTGSPEVAAVRPDVLTGRAAAYDYAGMFDTATRLYQEARAEGPLAGSLLCQLQIRLGKWDEAESILRELKMEEPENSAHWAMLWAMRGEYGKSLDCTQRALELEPDNAGLLANRAVTLLYTERFAEARDAALDALVQDESCQTAHAVLAQLEVHNQEWTAAENHADRALALDESGLALEARGYALLGLERREEAAIALEAFLELVELARPLECNLELRTARARAELEKLGPGTKEVVDTASEDESLS